MKHVALGLLFALSAFAVQARPAEAPVAPAAPVEAVEPANASEPAAAAEEPAIVIADEIRPETPRHCLRETGTRIKRRDRQGCTHAIGESYSADELHHSGGRDLAESLRLLSPRFGG